MTEPFEPWTAVLPVVDVLEILDVPYYVSGSLASSYSGIARATQDADLVADLSSRHVAPFISALQDRYYLSPDRVRSAIGRRKSFNLIHLETSFKIDVFVLTPDAFAQAAMKRRLPFELSESGRVLDFCAPEDIVLHKLCWFDRGNRLSDRQWSDLQGVLRLQRECLDLDHLRIWAENLGLPDLLEKALEEAGF
jgi:hypothetical protein